MPIPTPSYALPAALQGQNSWRGLAQFQKQIPGMFDTSGIQSNYETAIGSQMDQGRALAAAAGASYANRAAQSGGSSLGAGFATAQAMLPVYNQANQMRSDLAGKMLGAREQQASLTGDVTGRIGQLMQAQKGMLSDYYQNAQRLTQSGQEFNADLGFRNQQLQQNQSQFDSSLGERQHEFGVTSGQQSFQNRLAALQLAMKSGPNRSYRFGVNMSGNPLTPFDATQQQGYNQQNSFYSGLQNNLLGMTYGG